MQIQPVKQLRGEVSVPGDKSISHRSIMFGALAKGTTEITHFLHGADCLSTIGCFRAMGINIEDTPDRILVHGKGLHGLSEPSSFLDVGNSGTTTRLISGILSGQPFATTLSGDASLNSRPMKRIMEPLGMMGADILSQNGNGCAPLLINSHLSAGQNPSLHAIHYHSKVASAQVKSSVLLAGLYADGLTLVTEPVLSRNHTELMLNGFGANVQTEVHSDGSATASILPCEELYGQKILVPGDISSAAYFIAAALLVPGSELLIKNVGTNPTRAGILEVCRAMGADITYLNENCDSGEPTADLLVRTSTLHGTTVEGAIIPTLIDEIPMIAVMAAFAEGENMLNEDNWDNGFEIPKEILADPRCDLALALEIFYLSDGYAYLEDLEKTTDLKEWNSFITALYDDISNNKFPKTGKSFKIPLSKVQKYKLQKKGISKIFLIDL